MADEQACPFCNLKERTIMQNELASAFLSNPRKMPGHFLVAPRRHVEKPWEITKEEREAVFELIDNIEQRLIGKLGDGCDIRQNYRPFLEQSKLKVNHIHYHVMPRYLNDYLYQQAEKHETDVFTDLDQAEADEVAALFE